MKMRERITAEVKSTPEAPIIGGILNPMSDDCANPERSHQ